MVMNCPGLSHIQIWFCSLTKELPKSFLDLIPIILSGFINKVISRVVYYRLVVILPKIITQN